MKKRYLKEDEKFLYVLKAYKNSWFIYSLKDNKIKILSHNWIEELSYNGYIINLISVKNKLNKINQIENIIRNNLKNDTAMYNQLIKVTSKAVANEIIYQLKTGGIK